MTYVVWEPDPFEVLWLYHLQHLASEVTLSASTQGWKTAHRKTGRRTPGPGGLFPWSLRLMMPGAWTKLPGCGCQYHRRFSEDASKFLECGVERRTVFHGFSEEIFMGMPLLPGNW
nr:uncharacterized protein C5orf67 homolog isoform X2 [Macaca nemestrina]